MISKLKELADIVYENHNKPVSEKVWKDYTIENITIYVYQFGDEMSITALNIETQRQVDLTAKKYSKLFRMYVDNKVGVPTNNYKLKGINIIFINSIEQEETKELNSESKEFIYDKFIEYLKKTDNKTVDKVDIVRFGEEYGITLTAKMAKKKVIDKIIESGYIDKLYEAFSEFIYIPNWEVAKFYSIDSKVIDSLKLLGYIKEEIKESEFYNRGSKSTYTIPTYPISILSNYNEKELLKTYEKAYKQDQFRIRVTTDKEDDIQKIITELRKVFIVENDPAVYERRTKGFDNYLTIKISNNSEAEEKRYLKEIQELKAKLREANEEKYKIAERVYNSAAIKLLEKHYDKTGVELNYSIKYDLTTLGIFRSKAEEENQKVEIYFKYVEDGNIQHREFENSKVLNYFLEMNDVIKVTDDEIKEYNQKLKNENMSSADDECIKYLKEKFGEDYITKTKLAMEQLESERKKRSLAGRKAKFDENQIDKILELREKGKTIKELSEIFNCGVATIHKLITEKNK